jgi:uncharacterized protein (DUF2141 family)
MIRLSLVLFSLLISSLSLGSPPDKRDKNLLKIEIINNRSDSGWFYISVFNSPKGFPGDPNAIFKTYKVKAKPQKTELEIRDLPFGKYAVSILHDENDNKKLDTNFLGIPKEGFGSSNNPKSKFGPPKYKEALFEFKQGPHKMTIEMVYIL